MVVAYPRPARAAKGAPAAVPIECRWQQAIMRATFEVRVSLFSRRIMATVTIQESQARLRDLIHGLSPGDEVVIIENDQAVAKLVSEPSQPNSGLRPPPGLGKGFLTVLADDDEHLKDFKDYMP